MAAAASWLLLHPGVEVSLGRDDDRAGHDRVAEAAQLGTQQPVGAVLGRGDVCLVSAAPGTASCLMPSAGSQSEWIASLELMMRCTRWSTGMCSSSARESGVVVVELPGPLLGVDLHLERGLLGAADLDQADGAVDEQADDHGRGHDQPSAWMRELPWMGGPSAVSLPARK